MALRRRTFLGFVSVSVSTFSGCFNATEANTDGTPTPTVTPVRISTPTGTHSTPERPDDHPSKTFDMHIGNLTDEEQPVHLGVTRDDEELVNETFTLTPEGDEWSAIFEGYTEPGAYTITVEAKELRDEPAEETFDVEEHHLEDCNDYTVMIELKSDEQILMGFVYSPKYCDED